MVATTDCAENSKPSIGNKVSKPIMEKKRRARINKCLDQLKTLLESYYSSSIRKRKLEKADILELTVKHLRHLQKAQSFGSPAAELSDFQSGFHSCLASFNHYLLMADNLNERERWMLSQLPGNIRGAADTRDAPRGSPRGAPRAAAGPEPEEGAAVTAKARRAHGESAARCPRSEDAQDKVAVESPKNTHKKLHALRDCREEAAHTEPVWRPW